MNRSCIGKHVNIEKCKIKQENSNDELTYFQKKILFINFFVIMRRKENKTIRYIYSELFFF